jgi:hypothetical protein
MRLAAATKTEYRISNKEFRMTKAGLGTLPFDIGHSIFCGSLFNFFANHREVTD